jgi:hypothetical protein
MCGTIFSVEIAPHVFLCSESFINSNHVNLNSSVEKFLTPKFKAIQLHYSIYDVLHIHMQDV